MNEQFDKKPDSVYSKRIKAGKRRTYFFDVRATRGNDYFLTITESRKRLNDEGYDRHKIFLYKEDFHKFMKGLDDAVGYVKTELMPDFDFDSFNHDEEWEGNNEGESSVAVQKPLIDPSLLSHPVFDHQTTPTQIIADGVDGHVAKEGVDGHVAPDGVDEHSSKDGVDGHSQPEGKTVNKANFSEEVDKW